jgi:IS30 family transposase
MNTDIEKCPQLIVRRCECGEPNCDTIIFGMLHPVIVPVKERSEELVCVVNFPLEHTQKLVDFLREIALEKGVTIR